VKTPSAAVTQKKLAPFLADLAYWVVEMPSPPLILSVLQYKNGKSSTSFPPFVAFLSRSEADGVPVLRTISSNDSAFDPLLSVAKIVIDHLFSFERGHGLLN
jgi:hypothetical protein